MVNIGVVVEGHSEKIFIESDYFKQLCGSLNIQVHHVLNAAGNGNLCNANIQPLIEELRANTEIQQVLVLADLDPEICAPCITQRKERMGTLADHIVIARNAIEAWFLADHDFLKRQFGSSVPLNISQNCESYDNPFSKLAELSQIHKNRGLRNKKQFMKRSCAQFDLYRAAQHSPSAEYFLSKLQSLAQNP